MERFFLRKRAKAPYIKKLFKILPVDSFLEEINSCEEDKIRTLLSKDSYELSKWADQNRKTEKLRYLLKIKAFPNTDKELNATVNAFLDGLILEEKAYGVINDMHYEGFYVFLSINQKIAEEIFGMKDVFGRTMSDTIKTSLLNVLKKFEQDHGISISNKENSSEISEKEKSSEKESDNTASNKNASYGEELSPNDAFFSYRVVARDDKTKLLLEVDEHMPPAITSLLDLLRTLQEEKSCRNSHLMKKIEMLIEILKREYMSLEERKECDMDRFFTINEPQEKDDEEISVLEKNKSAALEGLDNDIFQIKDYILLGASNLIVGGKGDLSPEFSLLQHSIFQHNTNIADINDEENSLVHTELWQIEQYRQFSHHLLSDDSNTVLYSDFEVL